MTLTTQCTPQPLSHLILIAVGSRNRSILQITKLQFREVTQFPPGHSYTMDGVCLLTSNLR